MFGQGPLFRVRTASTPIEPIHSLFCCAKFPVRAKAIPCSVAQGIFRQHSEFAIKFALIFGSRQAIPRNSLFFSLITGNSEPETGSPQPASSARQSGLRGIISRCVRIRDIPAGYAGAPQSLAGNLRHFGPQGAGFGRRSLLAIFQFPFSGGWAWLDWR